MAGFGVRSLRAIAIHITATVAVGLGAHAFAQAETETKPASSTEAAPASTSAPSVSHEMTATDVETFFEGLIPYQIEVGDIAGATVAIVKDGKLLFAKGYGYSDVAAKTPVSAETTLFRVGSVSKLFTWTAVMQMVEQGKLDLDADVNQYLDFTLPQPFGKPVTLRNLMTHRPGYEEIYKEIGTRTTPNLGNYLKDHIPAQIFEPGSTPAYSNYGAALAGYVVERVSGVSFDQYVEDNITSKLGMTRTTFRQPLPDALAPLMSKGYGLASGEVMPFEMVNAYPAGSISASAVDMTRFMIAHLQDGQLDGVQILKPETARLMHDTRIETVPELNAMALGFYEETRNGHRIIGHGGDTIAFHSDLHLIPDAGVGFFVSYNSAGRGDTSPRGALWRKFLDRYFPYAPPETPTLPTAAADAQSVAGTYLVSRRQETSILKILGPLGEATVSARDDGTIEVDTLIGINGQPRRWREIAPLVFQDVATEDKIAFKRGAGDALSLFVGVPILQFDRIGWYQNQWFIMGVLGGSLLIMVLTLALWPAAAIARWHYGTPLPWTGSEKLLHFAVLLVLAIDVVFLVWLGVFLGPKFQSIWLLDRSLDPTINTIQSVGIAGALGSVLVVFNAVRAWLSETRGFFGKIKETLIALAAVGFAWFIWAMRLLDLGLRY